MTAPQQAQSSGRPTAGRFARAGFLDAPRAAATADRLALSAAVVDSLADAADPDLAMHALARLADVDNEVLPALADDALRRRLTGLLGASAALGEHLAVRTSAWRLLEDSASPDAGTLLAADTPDALRSGYRDCLVHLAARDVTGEAGFEAVAAELADLAAAALRSALAIARASTPGTDGVPLAVIALGKCGGHELNYVSDIDVVFVTGQEADLPAATRLAAALMLVCAPLWQVDAGLRPEGRNGPLVRTLASYRAYYERWAKTWEFQALLKALPVAGDADLGREFAEATAPLVWHAADRDHFVEDVQAMRRRVESTLPVDAASREIKLGPGGLRDVEFAVQLLQLVHGRADAHLRSATTVQALRDLADGGYVGREDAASLADAYTFLRTVEHRLQLAHLRRTHTLPDDDAQLRVLGRAVGFTTDPVAQLRSEHARHVREVRRLHEKLFYRPLLAAVAHLPGEQLRLSADAARARLTALGYADPAGALRHLEALTTGVSRRAAIQRTLLPVMLGWFADSPDPDAGLLAFRQVSDALGTTPWYLRQLRDEGVVAQRLAQLLSSSRYVVDLLLRAPDAVAMIADDDELRPRSREALTAELAGAAARHDDPPTAIATLRALRRRELVRIASADLLGLLDIDAVGSALTDVTAAVICAALDVAWRAAGHDPAAGAARLAVIAMGRLGGGEQGYGSDADVVFVHEPRPGFAESQAADVAYEVASELRTLLAASAADPPLEIDADLRPEGRKGALTRSVDSYAAYYARWSHVWESQALLRAAPLAGDAEVAARFMAIADEYRWPQAGIPGAAVREIRRIKARVESERLPRGADPALHTKLGRGGLADVEWTAQLLQLRHAGHVEALRTTSTAAALTAAAEARLLDRDDADTLIAAWRFVSRVRNAMMLARGRAVDAIPADLHEQLRIAWILGYSPSESSEFTEEYLRLTRRARAVTERVFYA